MTPKRKYDSTVALIAGSIAGGLLARVPNDMDMPFDPIAELSVSMARAIVAEVERTEPDPPA